MFLGKGNKVVKGKITVSSYGKESCRGKQQCPGAREAEAGGFLSVQV